MGWSVGPGIYVAEDCLLWPQWGSICLILKSVDAPGKEAEGGELRVGGWVMGDGWGGEHPRRV